MFCFLEPSLVLQIIIILQSSNLLTSSDKNKRLPMCNGSEISAQSKTDASSVQLSLSDKNEDEMERSFGLGKTCQLNRKIIDQQGGEQSRDQVQEKQCVKLLQIYDKIMLPAQSHEVISENILKQMTSFSAAELLNRESIRLWDKFPQQLSPQRYLKTIKSMNTLTKVSLITTLEGVFLAAARDKQEVRLLEAEPIAVELFYHRSQFLNNFHRRFSQDKALSPCSEEIIFLYQKYSRMKQSIISQLGYLRERSKHMGLQKEIELKMKQLSRELRILRTKRNRK